jgi:lysozyme family protein
VTVPKGRPSGDPPFSWEVSALDIIGFYHWQDADWSSVGAVLYRLEGMNGFGYRSHNVRSPYVWACTNLYTSGKFLSDHIFDPNVKDAQCGTGALLKLLVQRKIVEL